jgi:hypothetical protein
MLPFEKDGLKQLERANGLCASNNVSAGSLHRQISVMAQTMDKSVLLG